MVGMLKINQLSKIINIVKTKENGRCMKIIKIVQNTDVQKVVQNWPLRKPGFEIRASEVLASHPPKMDPPSEKTVKNR